MKRKQFLTTMLAGVPALMLSKKTDAVALPAVTICIYVQITVGVFTLKYLGCFTIAAAGTVVVQVSIFDTRVNAWVIRIAYQADGVTPYKASTATVITVTGTTLP